MQSLGISPLEHGAEQKRERMYLIHKQNSQHPWAPHLQGGTDKCNSLLCPEGEKLNMHWIAKVTTRKGSLTEEISLFRNVQKQWGFTTKFSLTKHLRFSVHYSLLQNVLWGKVPSPFWPYTLIATEAGQVSLVGCIWEMVIKKELSCLSHL